MKAIEAEIRGLWGGLTLDGGLVDVNDEAGCYIRSRQINLDGRRTRCYGVSCVYVTPERRHSGVGRKLLEKVLKLYNDRPVVCFIRPELVDFYCGWQILFFDAESNKIAVCKCFGDAIGKASLMEGDRAW